MKTYYVVTAGDYSDYHVVTVTDSKEKAERIKDLCNREKYGYNSYARIEEYEETISNNKFCYCVSFTDGREPFASIYFNASTEIENKRDINVVDEYGGYYDVLVMAKDENHAIKIASDLVAQYKAEKEGVC